MEMWKCGKSGAGNVEMLKVRGCERASAEIIDLESAITPLPSTVRKNEIIQEQISIEEKIPETLFGGLVPHIYIYI